MNSSTKKTRQEIINARRSYMARAAVGHSKFVARYLIKQGQWVSSFVRTYHKGLGDAALDAVFSQWRGQDSILIAGISAFIPRVVGRGGQDALDQTGVTIDFSLNNPAVQSWIERYAVNDVRLISNTTRKILRDLIAEATLQGDTIDEISDSIMSEYVSFTPYRARRIARTETAKGYSQGSLFGYRQSNLVKEIEWFTANDGSVCPICQGNQAKGAVLMGSDFPSGHEAPPAHPNCRCTILPIID